MKTPGHILVKSFYSFKIQRMWEFPGCPVVRTQCFHCPGQGSIPFRGTKMPQAMQHGQKKKKDYRECNRHMPKIIFQNTKLFTNLIKSYKYNARTLS